MCDISQWKKIKKSGAFRRRMKMCYENMMKNTSTYSAGNQETLQKDVESIDCTQSADAEISMSENTSAISITKATATENPQTVVDLSNNNTDIVTSDDEVRGNWLIELESNEDCDSVLELEQNAEFRNRLRQWAVSFNISHSALRVLFRYLNGRMPNILPHDPRTLLKTYHTIVMVKIGENGHYWHHGLQFSLQKMLTSIQNLPKKISLNISMDGLPIYKSSRSEFWPILFNIHELPEIKPMIIGIYCGKGKPSNLAEYLTPFVEEAKPILSEGLIINGNNTTVKIRCFVCDSPARAFIKGVTNFNSKHGCLKCTTVGEYSHISHTVYFPTIGCEKRTNAGFHAKLYGSHHKQDTPLSLLPIDMVEDFPVSDSLHLIDLGVMKRCLLGWRDGSFGTYKTKWCAKDITDVSHFLEKCKLPSEVHRAVRGLNVLCHWKGSEYHTFLHYLSIVILKDVLPLDVYQHFLNFFCAITICSTKYYVHFLHLAEALLNNYVEYYRDFYGEDYITSNVHNLTHLVDEVRRYGPLTTFNAYPFESRLYQIKNLLRNGNSPLAQVAKRMSEIIQCENESKKYCTSFPVLKSKNDSGFFSKIELKQFSLSADNRNKWFLTHNDDIVAMEYAILINNTPLICGHAVGDNLQEVFEIPIKSSFLNIFKTNNNNQKPLKLYSTTDVKCKMVATKYRDEFFFIPLLHTLHENK